MIELLKFTKLGGGKRRAFALLTALLFVVSFLPLITITTSEPVRAQVENSPSVVGTSTNAYATFYSHQRKTFYAAGRFWVWYSENGSFVYRSSTDGASWSDATSVGMIGDGYNGAIWFDGTYVHYVRYASYDLYYRRGTPNSDGTISWSAAEQTVYDGTSTGADFYNYPNITVDSGGYAWIGAHYNAGTENNMVLKNADNDGTWSTDSGFPYELKAGPIYYTSIIPLTNLKVYAIYGKTKYSAKGKLWNGSSWDSEETVASDAERGYGHSAVVVGDDIHLVFLHDTAATGIVYNKRTYGEGWGTEATVQANQADYYMTPVLSIDTATNDLYCFWAGSPDANKIYYKKQVSGSWDTDPTLWLDETSDTLYRNDVLTCFYQAYSNKIGLLYTTKTASPYNVKFDFLELAAQPPTKPVLVSPENNHSTSDNTPTFTWTAGSNATSHRLVIDNDSIFSDGDNIYDNANLGATATTCTIENELPPDNYWWKVCASNAEGDNWSENPWTFEIIPAPEGIYVYPPEVYVVTTWTVPGETVKVSVLVLDASNAPITGLPSDNVNYDLLSPQGNLVAENVGLVETIVAVCPGLYENSWTFASTDNLGTWTVYVAVDSAGTKSYSIAHIRLEPSIVRIENKIDWVADYLENTMKPELDSILDNVQNNYTYLSGTIKPQLDAMLENIDKTLDNAVAVYTYLTGTIKPAIDDAYGQAVANYNYLTGTIKPQLDNIQENLSVTAELPENVKENIFATYSFLTENIKPELDNVYENVNASYSYLINTINPKLDEIAAEIGVGLSIEVTRYYQLSEGDLQEFYVTIKKGTNVDWVTITLEDPKSTLVVDNASMSNPETGGYYYGFSTSGREPGGWLATIVAKDENLMTTYRGFWRLGGEGEAVGYLTLTILDNETHEPIEGVKIELYRAGTIVESKYTRWDGKAWLDIMTWGIHELKWSKSGYESEVMEIDLAVSSELTLRMVPTEEMTPPPLLYLFVAVVIGGILLVPARRVGRKEGKEAGTITLTVVFILPLLLLAVLWLVGVV